jgi:hypothetical protein
MLHTIEDLIHRIDVMKMKADQLLNYHQNSIGDEHKLIKKNLLDDIQQIALGIARDKEGDIKSKKDG